MTKSTHAVRNNLEQALESIKKLDHRLHAWEELFESSARYEADCIDQTSASGPLRGVLIGIKDIFELIGRPPGNGASILPSRIPHADASLIRKLRAAGAIIVGTTKLTEFCGPRPGPTRNPHNLQHTPGGSSSGSAAAVAAGMIPVAIGSQTKGSTIRPASFCGIYGFKPSFDAVDITGMTHLTRSFDHPGIFARNAEDLSKVFEVLARYDSIGSASYSRGVHQWKTKALKIGVLDVSGIPVLDREMADTTQRYAQVLKDEGYNVKDISVPDWFTGVDDIFRAVFLPEVNDQLGYILDASDSNGLEVRKDIEEGRTVPVSSYFAGLRMRDELFQKVHQLFADVDLIVLPSALGPAPKGLQYTGDPIMTAASSITGIPAASIPFGVSSEGLPLGIQVWAPKYHDRFLLSALHELPCQLIPPSWTE